MSNAFNDFNQCFKRFFLHEPEYFQDTTPPADYIAEPFLDHEMNDYKEYDRQYGGFKKNCVNHLYFLHNLPQTVLITYLLWSIIALNCEFDS